MFARLHHGRVLLSAIVFMVASVALAHTEPEAVPGEFLVKLKSSNSIKTMGQLSLVLGARVKEVLPHNIVVVQRAMVEQRAFSLQTLRNNPNVELVEPNYIYRINGVPNDADMDKLWGMVNHGQVDSEGHQGIEGVDINASKAWDITTGSRDMIIASIDTGVDGNIADLKENMWVNEAEAAGQAGVDDDKNGYVDDIHGWNFVANTSNSTDDHGHGSHTSGTIGAKGDDKAGVAGVNWNVRIMSLKFLSAEGSGSLDGAIKAIDYATANGAKIMSNSWGGGGFSQLLQDAIQRANDKNILFVAAAGNSGSNNDQSPEYPANYALPNVISVAAIDNRGQLADFSCYGRQTVHIAAPGVNIYSTLPTGFESWSGTSMATPHVSGVAGLVWSHEPNLTAVQVKERLLARARPLSALRGKVATAGMVDAYYALTDTAPPLDMNDPVNWQKQDYQVSTPHPYTNSWQQTYTITVPGATRFTAYFSKFRTERRYDPVQFFDKDGKKIGEMSGNNDDSFSPIVNGDTLVIKVTTDDTKTDYGFDITAIAVP